MKKLILIILILLIPLTVSARMTTAIVGGGVAAAASCADTSCTGFLACQNFETSSSATDVTLDNSETWSNDCSGDAAPTTNSTSSPLRGSQSCILTANTGEAQISKAITGSGEIYVVFQINRTSNLATLTDEVMRFWDSGYSTIGLVSIRAEDWGGDKRKAVFTHGSAEIQSTTLLNAGTTYWVWLRWKKGTGANGLYDIAVTTSTTAPVAWETSGTNGTGAADVAFVTIQAKNGQVSKFDRVLVKTTAIGTVCD